MTLETSPAATQGPVRAGMDAAWAPLFAKASAGAAIAYAVLALTPTLMTASFPLLSKGAIGVLIVGYGGAAVTALIVFLLLVRIALRSGSSLASRSALVAGGLIALGTPLAWVYLTGEIGSGFWYLVYGLFLPAGLLLGGGIGLLAPSFALRDASRIAWLLGVLGAIGAVGAAFLSAGIFYPRVGEVLAGPGALLAALGIASHAALALHSRGVLRASGGSSGNAA